MSPQPLVLAIETSCDETAVAVMHGRHELLAGEVFSQIALHQPHGGVVPEVASRNHLVRLRTLIDRALNLARIAPWQLDAVAATSGPGLASSLLIGSAAAKGLALAIEKPFLAINHLEGHLASPFFGSETGVQPCVALVVSGGHTMLVDVEGFALYRVLGRTRDDAAGEAFDKVAKLLGLPYPGGPEIDRLARQGDPARFDLPRSMLDSGDSQFSFSGLKTAVRYLLPKLEGDYLADLCASFQEAVVDVLVRKTVRAAGAVGKTLVAVSGGVSMNSRLREKFRAECARRHLRLVIAEPALCTDNAAMIGYVAIERLLTGRSSPLTEDIDPNLNLAA